MTLCGLETLQIFFLTDFHRPQRCQMIGHELAVEQLKAPDLQPRHQPGERNL